MDNSEHPRPTLSDLLYSIFCLKHAKHGERLTHLRFTRVAVERRFTLPAMRLPYLSLLLMSYVTYETYGI